MLSFLDLKNISYILKVNNQYQKKRTSAFLMDTIFRIVSMGLLIVLVSLVGLFLFFFIQKGNERLSIDFITSYNSILPSKAGIKASLIGSLLILLVVVTITIPLAIGSAIFIKQIASKSIGKLLEWVMYNLNGVPSIIYGILGSFVFLRTLSMGSNPIVGGLTLSFIILPMTIVFVLEAIERVDDNLIQQSYAMGASKWQVILTQVLPNALSSIVTGVILAISRALGETAPLLMVGAVSTINFIPTFDSSFSALPHIIYEWIEDSNLKFSENAAAATVVLLSLTLVLNITAMTIKYSWFKRNKYIR